MCYIQQLPDHCELELVETFIYYDQPVLFTCKSLSSEVHSCKDAKGKLYLAVAADENETMETWLYVEISDQRLCDLKSGVIDLRSAFAEPEQNTVIELVIPFQDYDIARVNYVCPTEVNPDFLPVAGEYLND